MSILLVTNDLRRSFRRVKWSGWHNVLWRVVTELQQSSIILSPRFSVESLLVLFPLFQQEHSVFVWEWTRKHENQPSPHILQCHVLLQSDQFAYTFQFHTSINTYSSRGSLYTTTGVCVCVCVFVRQDSVFVSLLLSVGQNESSGEPSVSQTANVFSSV